MTLWDIECLLSWLWIWHTKIITSLWNVTSIMLTSLKNYPKWCGAVIVACFYALCVYVREKAHSRCLALVIVFEEDGLVFSDALHLPPPIPVCCWNRKWVLGSVQLLCCASGSHNTLWLCVCLWEGQECSTVCVPEPGYVPFIFGCFLTLNPTPFSYT